MGVRNFMSNPGNCRGPLSKLSIWPNVYEEFTSFISYYVDLGVSTALEEIDGRVHEPNNTRKLF
jgi:hypothetical protein